MVKNVTKSFHVWKSLVPCLVRVRCVYLRLHIWFPHSTNEYLLTAYSEYAISFLYLHVTGLKNKSSRTYIFSLS